MKKINLFYSSLDSSTLNKVKEAFVKEGFVVDEKDPDVIICLGGDGTFLKAIHHYLDKLNSVKFVGLNYGNLGFFYDYTDKEIDLLIKDLKEDKLIEHVYPMIETDLGSGYPKITSFNEVRIENPFVTMISEVYINNELLETFRGNGLIVSSSVGSSAYNRSLGGAIIDSSINSLQLSEIASIQNNAFRSLGSSLVLPTNAKITLKGDFVNVVVGYDSFNVDVKGLKEINITGSDKKVTILNTKSHSNINKMRKSFVQ